MHSQTTRIRSAALGFLLVGTVLYLATGAWLLRFTLTDHLLPPAPAFIGPPPRSVERLQSERGNEMLIRRYGEAHVGCVVLFPGQHGYAPKYDPTPYTVAGLQVLILAYPGQDGTAGRASLDEVETLARLAVRRAIEICPERKVVLVGVSLGAMLAAYSSRDMDLAGLVLISTAPSLSTGIRVRIESTWYLMPLRVLPLSLLLPRDYSLMESLRPARAHQVVIFQGTEDEQTPLTLLDDALSSIENTRVVRISGGTHSATFALSRDAQIALITAMLSQSTELSRPETAVR